MRGTGAVAERVGTRAAAGDLAKRQVRREDRVGPAARPQGIRIWDIWGETRGCRTSQIARAWPSLGVTPSPGRPYAPAHRPSRAAELLPFRREPVLYLKRRNETCHSAPHHSKLSHCRHLLCRRLHFQTVLPIGFPASSLRPPSCDIHGWTLGVLLFLLRFLKRLTRQSESKFTSPIERVVKECSGPDFGEEPSLCHRPWKPSRPPSATSRPAPSDAGWLGLTTGFGGAHWVGSADR
jgi:hypothetical protein